MFDRKRLLALMMMFGLASAGCAADAELSTLDTAGPNAEDIDSFMTPIFWVAIVIGIVIMGIISLMAVRHRVHSYEEGDDFPEQTHGHTKLELLWTAIPAIIIVFIAFFTVVGLNKLNSTEANALSIDVGDNAVDWEPRVVVVGQQWWWEYRYYFDDQVSLGELRATTDPKDLPPADIVTSGQLVIPAGEEIELIITSRDVIHSFWIPALNGKRDSVPGRFSPWNIEADDPGIFFGQCTEYCGLSHARMRMQVVAKDQADFQKWVDVTMADAAPPSEAAAEWLAAWRAGEPADAPVDTAAERGLVAFTGNCVSCHLIEGVNDHNYVNANQQSLASPNLTHFASRTTFAGGVLNLYNPDGSLNRDDLERWLRNPASVKANASNAIPPRGMPNLGLSEQTIDDLVAYLETLGPRPTDFEIAATEVE